MQAESKLSLYKSKAIHDLIRRYPFTEEQKSTIYAAIATARRDKPNMKLIDKADTILSETARNNPDAAPTEMDKKEMARAQANAARVSSEKKYQAAKGGKFPLWIIAIMIIWAIGGYVFKDYTVHKSSDNAYGSGRMSFNDAKDFCLLTKVAELPLYAGELPNEVTPDDQRSKIGYWTSDRQVLYADPDFRKKEPAQDERYYVECSKMRSN